MTKAIALFVAIFIGAASYVSADVLAQYDFTLGTSSTDTNLQSTAGAFTNGAGFTGSIVTTQGSTAGNPSYGTSQQNGASGVDATTTALAITNNEYFSFTITPNAGLVLNLDSISFSMQVGITLTTATQDTTYALFSSVNGFSIGSVISSNTYTENSDGNASTSSLDSFVNTGTIALTGSAYDNVTGQVEFRIYLSDGGSNNAAPLIKIDDVILNGTTAPIPEPSTYAMMGLGAAMLVGIQRFRRKNS